MISFENVSADHLSYYGRSAAAGGVKPRFLGKGIDGLGIDFEAIDIDFALNLMHHLALGEGPDGKKLVRSGSSRHNPGMDCTYSSDKGGSLLAWIGRQVPSPTGEGDLFSALQGVHEHAVAKSLAYLEAEAGRARTGAGGMGDKVAGGILVTAFDHALSRDLDPQTHTHALLWNLLHIPGADGQSGKWAALAMRMPVRHMKTAAAIYRAELRAGRRRLGISHVQRRDGYFEVAGIDAKILRHFSKRTQEIDEAAPPGSSIKARKAATIATRADKDVELEWSDISEDVARQLWETFETTPAEILGAVLGDPVAAPKIPKNFAQLVTGPDGLTYNRAAFCRQDVTRFIANYFAEGLTYEEIESLTDDVLSSDGIIPVVVHVVEDGKTTLLKRGTKISQSILTLVPAQGELPTGAACELRYTTAETLDLEKYLLSMANTAGNPKASFRTAAASDTALAAALYDEHLSPEQEAMVAHVTGSKAVITLVDGWAGTGKTYGLGVCKRALEGSGKKVIGAVQTGQIADHLREETGIDASTVARLLGWLDSDRLRLTSDHVLIIDEASQLDTRTLSRLVHYVEAARARLVLVGSTIQLPSIEAGGMFSTFCRRFGAAELRVNQRQAQQWQRDALVALHEGRAAQAIYAYSERGKIVASHDYDELTRAMVAEWMAQRTGGQARMFTNRVDTKDTLNGLAHWSRAGELEGLDVVVPSVLKWIAPSSATRWSRSGGEVLPDRAYRVGEAIVCRANKALPVPGRLDRVQVYNNGTRGVVTAFHQPSLLKTGKGKGQIDPGSPYMTIRTESGAEITLPYWYVVYATDYDYAATIHASQGATVGQTGAEHDPMRTRGTALVLVDDWVDRELLYVALSRATDDTIVFLKSDAAAACLHNPLGPPDEVKRVGGEDPDEAGVTAYAIGRVPSPIQALVDAAKGSGAHESLTDQVAAEARVLALAKMDFPQLAQYKAAVQMHSGGADFDVDLAAAVIPYQVATARFIEARLARDLAFLCARHPRDNPPGDVAREIASLQSAIHQAKDEVASAEALAHQVESMAGYKAFSGGLLVRDAKVELALIDRAIAYKAAVANAEYYPMASYGERIAKGTEGDHASQKIAAKAIGVYSRFVAAEPLVAETLWPTESPVARATIQNLCDTIYDYTTGQKSPRPGSPLAAAQGVVAAAESLGADGGAGAKALYSGLVGEISAAAGGDVKVVCGHAKAVLNRHYLENPEEIEALALLVLQSAGDRSGVWSGARPGQGDGPVLGQVVGVLAASITLAICAAEEIDASGAIAAYQSQRQAYLAQVARRQAERSGRPGAAPGPTAPQRQPGMGAA